nr:Wzz/FepE/Etk N-terminal domain-containing protein [uncultured Devosia sp.]
MEETTIDLRSIADLLRRQFRLIAISVISVVLLAGLVTFSLTPIYSASTLILVDPTRKNLLDPEAQMMGTSSDSARIDSEVEILRSDNVLLKVIEAEDLTADASVGVSLSLRERVLTFLRLADPAPPTATEALNQALNNLRNAVSVQRRGLTYLIAVSARSQDPERAARLANAISQAYIEDQVQSKVSSTLASRDILQARIVQAREAITMSEGSFDSFIDTNIERIATDSGRSDLTRIQQQIRQLNQARNDNARIADQVQNSLANDDWETVVASLQSQALSELERQRADLANQLSGTAEGSAVAVDLQQELASIESRLRDTATSEVSALRQSVTDSQTQEDALRQDLRRDILNGSLPPDVLTDIFELQQNAELARNQYQTLLSRVQDLEAQADLQVADSRIVSPALPPERPAFPNRLLIMAVAGVAAVGLGVALAFLYENVIGGFTSEAQLASVLRTRVAGAVPRQKAKSEKESLANLMVNSPLSVFAESIRRLRATLEQSIRSSGKQSEPGTGHLIMVSSTAPNEGKTTLALALARSYALSGNSTLLIDCDLRKPSLHRHLGIEPSQGLLEFLTSDDSENFNSIISHDTMSSATIIVGARRSDVPTDQLLTGRSFARLIHAARRTFDVVIVDTPPVGPVVDSLYVAPSADAIVFVTRWASTSQQDAKQAVTSLMENKAPNAEIVAVINQQDQTRAAYMRKYGNYYTENE